MMTYHAAVNAFRRELIARTLAECGGNKTHAARALGIGREYLLKLIRDHGIARESA